MSLNSPENQNAVSDAVTAALAADPAANVDAIVDSLVATMPDVQEHAVAAHFEKEKDAHLRDKNGTLFDPSFHAVGPDGKPALNKAGDFARKRGRKAGQSTSGSVSQDAGKLNGVHNPGTPSGPAPGMMTADPNALGLVAAALTINLGVAFGGEDFMPIIDAKSGVNEPEFLRNIYRDYFIATGRKDLPPGLALAVGIGSYVGPRFTKPRVKARVWSAFEAAKNAWQKWRGKRPPVATPIAPEK